MSKKIIVIGAGPGGLAASMLLAHKGYDVHVYEKQSFIGGRTSHLQLGDYRFDVGPTFLNMTYLAEEMFALTGRNIHDYVKLMDLDPMYELVYKDKRIKITRNPEEMIRQINELFPGNYGSYERYLLETHKKLETLAPLLQSDMTGYRSLMTPKAMKALKELEIGNSLMDTLGKFFKEEELRLAFTFQSKYLGMSPWESPGAFSILSYIEHAYGVYHIEGGLNQLTKAMAKVAEEEGAVIKTGNGVKRIVTEGRVVKGVELESGEVVYADDVVINGDFASVMTKLVEPGLLKKYSPEKLAKKSYSCSGVLLYLGVNKKFDLPHHTIWFAEDYRKNVAEITNTLELSEDPSIYIQNACVSDPTLAPEGKSTLYVLAPVPNNFSNIDWESCRDEYRDMLLGLVSEKLGIDDINDYIEEAHMITPADFEVDYEVYKGAIFNLGHQLRQMMAFRPNNKFEELDHCYLVGGGTHPGSGLPIIIESARITANLILKRDKQTPYDVQPLPPYELYTGQPQDEKSSNVAAIKMNPATSI
ncbi:MAG: phytoene desaturase family protein [Caryophanon sp.]|nr:phytoene desaturase family protein [Caryophanon sp.]